MATLMCSDCMKYNGKMRRRIGCGGCCGRVLPPLLESARSIFPYPNYWHGDFRCSVPIVDDRRAGWRPRVDITPAIPQKVDDFRLPPHAFDHDHSHLPAHQRLVGENNSRAIYLRVDRQGDDREPTFWTVDAASPYFEELLRP